MRLYAKLVPLIALFAYLISPAGRAGMSELAYQARVAAVMRFGSQADFDALVEDTQQMLAANGGRPDVFRAGLRYNELFNRGIADAARRNVLLTEDELHRLRAECAREAFGQVQAAFDAGSDRTVRRGPDVAHPAPHGGLSPSTRPQDP